MKTIRHLLTRRANLPIRHLVLYGRPGCHLCEDARVLLNHLQQRFRLEIEEIDITSDPALMRRYDLFIPVVVIDGQLELMAPLHERTLRRALED